MKQPVLLIVDDEKDIRALYHSIVNRNFNFDTLEAESLEAVKSLLSNTIPDFVLLDLCLKDGSGFDIIPALKNVNPDVKILIITAFNHCKEKRKAVDMGAIGLLAKPFDQNQLIDRLKSMSNTD